MEGIIAVILTLFSLPSIQYTFFSSYGTKLSIHSKKVTGDLVLWKLQIKV